MKELSARERQILGLASAGLLDKNISAELDISPNTLRTYWQRIRAKCGNLPRAALTAAFVQGRLAEAGEAPFEAPVTHDPLSTIDDPVQLRQSAIYYATELRRVQDSFGRTERACRVYVTFSRRRDTFATPAEFSLAVCRILVEQGKYLMAWIGMVNRDRAKSISVLSSFGDNYRYLDGIRISWGEGLHGRGPAGLAVRTGEASVNQDFLASLRMEPWRDRAIVSGFQSSISLPIARRGDVFAVLSAYAEEPDAFSDQERGMLEELVSDVSTRWTELFP